MTAELPPDPFVNTDMLPMARNAFDMFTAFRSAGFTEAQALQITVAIVTTAISGISRPPATA